MPYFAFVRKNNVLLVNWKMDLIAQDTSFLKLKQIFYLNTTTEDNIASSNKF